MVATEVRHRRGTNDQHLTFTGAQGEFTFVTDLKTLRLHDAVTPGGIDVGLEAGTVLLFHQSAAPTGWTKTVSSTLDNHAIRIVTDTAWSSGSLGGADEFDTVFGSAKATDTFALTSTHIPSTAHAHSDGGAASGGSGSTTVSGGSVGDNAVATNSGDGSSGAATAHGHDVGSMDLSFADMILATKD